MQSYRITSKVGGVVLGTFDGETPNEAFIALCKAAGYTNLLTTDSDGTVLCDRSGVDIVEVRWCACGCGEPATTTIRRLRDQDRGTAEALKWVEASVDPMRVDIDVAEGHDPSGYVNEEHPIRYILRFYEHPDTRARVAEYNGVELTPDEAPEVDAHGWNYGDGDIVEIGGEPHVLMNGVGVTGIRTDDTRGNYIEALAEVDC